MKIRAIAAVLAFAYAISPAVAEEWWLKSGPGSKTDLFKEDNSCWTNSSGQANSGGDYVLQSTDVLHVQGIDCTLTKDSSFAGVLHAGAVDGSGTAKYINLSGYTLDLSNLKWHNATFRIYSGKKLGILTGAATLDNSGSTHTIGVVANNSYGGFILGSAMTCADSAMQVTISTSSGDAYYTGLTGDNSGYQGNFKQSTSLTPLFVGHANALGSPSVSRTDALLIDAANAVFSVVKGVTPNEARGIDINKSGFHICATNYSDFADGAADYRDCTEFELPMPITGSYGFTKTGPGTVTLSGDYTASDIVVESGTLIIASSAEFPAGQNISVSSGAALYVHQPLSRFNITAAEGAMVEYVLDTLEVAYDDSTHTATALARGSSFSVPEGIKQPIALSSAISIPMYTALHLEVLTVASGAATLSADDFTDETPKTFGLPKTSFEVTTDGAGVQHVYLNVRPVVVSVADFNNSTWSDITLNGNASVWSNEGAAQSGFDYLITNTVGQIGNVSFNGDSLTIASANVYTRGVSTISSATIWPGTLIRQNKSGTHTVSGNVSIAGEYEDASYLTFLAFYKGGWTRLSANLSGDGPLKLQGGGAGDDVSNVAGSPQLYGDNSAYFGKMYVTSEWAGRAEGTGASLEFNSAAALGGALDTFKYDSLTLDNYSTLRPTTSIDFSTENRGIYGSGPFGFIVQDGITFKVGVPVKMDDIMFKHGAGDLILGGAISFGGSSSKTCYVREGGIGALNDAAVAGLDVVFSNGTKIVLSDDATLVNGFTGVSFEPADATVTVDPASGFTPPSDGSSFTMALATIPASEGDLSSHFAPERLRGYTETIVKESVSVNEVSCYRYSVKYSHNGMVIIVR